MILYGASGHGKVIADILKKSGETNVVFWDDNANARIEGYEVQIISNNIIPSDSVIISIGDNTIRQRIALSKTFTYGKAIHPSAVEGENVSIDEGTVVMAGTVINSSTRIGKHCILNTASTIDHDCIIEDFVHISPNATLSGGVSVGEGSWIGAGAVVIHGVKIGRWAIVGAGSVIIEDIPDYAVVVGNPGSVIKYIKATE
jgi:sugar O-acyltransferase (sialic acid O-acetyltransferase NeuD family)